MALILTIETATPTCSVALSENGIPCEIEERTASNIHAGVITLFIEAVMERAGRQLHELDAVCVSKGPGSYTGLRIGVSTAKGLCYALDKPLIAVNTLEAMASGLLAQRQVPAKALLCPMLDARRMEVFMAVYTGNEQENNTVREVEGPRAQVMDAHTLDPWLSGNKLLLFGTGAAKCEELYRGRPEIEVISGFNQSAASLAAPAERRFAGKQFEDAAYFEPYYLKDFIKSSH